MKIVILSLTLILALSGLSYAKEYSEPNEEQITETSEINNAFYAGLGYSYLSSNRTATTNDSTDPNHGQIVRNTDSTANNILLQLGYQFNPYIALEGRYTFSVGNHSLEHKHNNGKKEDVDIDISNIALYLKPSYPIKKFSIYGLLGYGKTKRIHNVAGHIWRGNGFQFGLGLQYIIIDNLSVFTDYTIWYDKEKEDHDKLARYIDTEFSTINIGLTYNF